MGPLTAENRVKPWSETQNQAKRINEIVFLSLLRDQGVRRFPTIFNHLSRKPGISATNVGKIEAVKASEITKHVVLKNFSEWVLVVHLFLGAEGA